VSTETIASRLPGLITLTALLLLAGGIALKTDLATAAIVIGALLLADVEVDDIMARRAGPSS